jgi:RNA polymerase sigma factor (TIGR02999 family)
MPGQAVTLLLQQLKEGRKDVVDELMPLVYSELRQLASSFLRRERQDHTLQATALVNEAYLRLVGGEQPDYQSRAHFMGVAARAMRQILVDHARTHKSAKRGDGAVKMPFDESMDFRKERASQVIALDDALKDLERSDPLKGRLVEMRFFGGLTAEESADVLGLPVTTVRSQLRIAMAVLSSEMGARGFAS